MSARRLTWAHSVALNRHALIARSAQRSVLVMLADYANGADEAWPAVATMAELCCVSAATVRKALNALEADGLIAPVGRRSGGRVPTRWRLQADAHPLAGAGDEADDDEGQPTEGWRVEDAQPAEGWRVEGDDMQRSTRQRATPNPPTLNANPPTLNANPLTVSADPLEPAENPQGNPSANKRRAARSAKARQPSRRQGDGGAPPDGRAQGDPDGHARAVALTKQWWEAQHLRPNQPYPAALSVVASALRAGGWADDAELLGAMNAIGAPLSGSRLDYWRNHRANGRHAKPATPEGALAYLDAQQRFKEELRSGN